MTRNLAIATLFMLASVFVLGYSWLAERSNLAVRNAQVQGQQLSRGARDYEQYCARCHGLTGEGIIGPRINFLYVASKDASGTTVETGTLVAEDRWNGENQIKAKYGTVHNYVQATLISGVRGAAMPAWSNRVGGPLRDDQIENIANYVLSWQGQIPANAAQAAEAYQATQSAGAAAASTDPRDQGKAIFGQYCTSCHNINEAAKVGPGLGGLFSPEGTVAYGPKLPNGKDVNVADWKEWVLKGSAGFKGQLIEPVQPYWKAGGARGVMPAFKLSDAQLNSLVAYLSQHGRDGTDKFPALGPDGKPLPAGAAGAKGTPQAAPAGTPQKGATPGTGPTLAPAQPGATTQPTNNPLVASPKPGSP